MSIFNKLFNRGPQAPLADGPQAVVTRVPLPDFGPPEPPSTTPPAKTRGDKTIYGLEGMAREAAKRLGVTQPIHGFRREQDGEKIFGVSTNSGNNFTPKLFFNLLKEAKLEFQPRAEVVSELARIEAEIEAFVASMMKFATTPENARRLMDEHEKMHGGTDYLALRGNYTLCYDILGRNLAEKKEALKSIRLKRAPFIAEFGRELKHVLNTLLVNQLETELTQSEKLEMVFLPSALLTTIFDAVEQVESQIQMADKGIAHASIGDLFWGIAFKFLKDKSA
jgi:hypothetical protein